MSTILRDHLKRGRAGRGERLPKNRVILAQAVVPRIKVGASHASLIESTHGVVSLALK